MTSIDRLYDMEIGALVISADQSISESLPKKPLVLAGSFNPLHEGHKTMLEIAEKRTGRAGFFEISVQNVDKPQLERGALNVRTKSITQEGRAVIVTNAPRFTEKSAILPGATFIIGYDTAVRLIDPKYYPDHSSGTPDPVEDSLNIISANGCSFIVVGRIDSDGEFKVLQDIPIPGRFKHLFEGLSESEFRSDLSSTEIRTAGR